MTDAEVRTLARFQRLLQQERAGVHGAEGPRKLLVSAILNYEVTHGRRAEVVQIPEDWIEPLRIVLESPKLFEGECPLLFGIPVQVVAVGRSLRFGLFEEMAEPLDV